MCALLPSARWPQPMLSLSRIILSTLVQAPICSITGLERLGGYPGLFGCLPLLCGRESSSVSLVLIVTFRIRAREWG